VYIHAHDRRDTHGVNDGDAGLAESLADLLTDPLIDSHQHRRRHTDLHHRVRVDQDAPDGSGEYLGQQPRRPGVRSCARAT
jgi:hypothetical protein